jgi:hypothetical protein
MTYTVSVMISAQMVSGQMTQQTLAMSVLLETADFATLSMSAKNANLDYSSKTTYAFLNAQWDIIKTEQPASNATQIVSLATDQENATFVDLALLLKKEIVSKTAVKDGLLKEINVSFATLFASIALLRMSTNAPNATIGSSTKELALKPAPPTLSLKKTPPLTRNALNATTKTAKSATSVETGAQNAPFPSFSCHQMENVSILHAQKASASVLTRDNALRAT